MKYLKLFEEARVKWYKRGEFSDPEEIDDITGDQRRVIYNEFFTDFLIKHKAYDNFVDEVCRSRRIDKNDTQAFDNFIETIRSRHGGDSNVINYAFTWSMSLAKSEYWSGLHDLLIEELEKAGLLDESAIIKWYKKGAFTEEHLSDEKDEENPIYLTNNFKDNKKIIEDIISETEYGGYYYVFDVNFSESKPYRLNFNVDLTIYDEGLNRYTGNSVYQNDIKYVIIHILKRFENSGYKFTAISFYGPKGNRLLKFDNIENYLSYNEILEVFNVSITFS